MGIGDKIATKTVYGQKLVELGRRDERIVVIEADLMKASGSEPFFKAYPERHFNVGIAEQNLVGVAAGFAAMGKMPFASGFSGFLVQRACDQDINAVAYNDFNVKLVGSYAGFSQEKNGGTHISVIELTLLRCIPRMVVLAPADGIELAAAMEAAADYVGPVYIRMARGPLVTILPEDYKFEIGKAVTLDEGDDATILTTGITTWEAIKACDLLKARGIRARHLHLPTVKPLDREAIVNAARETGLVVTVEDQSRLGGLGGAVCELLAEEHPTTVMRLGLDDCFGETALLEELMDKFEISAAHIARAVERQLHHQALKVNP
jgi:transketolase